MSEWEEQRDKEKRLRDMLGEAPKPRKQRERPPLPEGLTASQESDFYRAFARGITMHMSDKRRRLAELFMRDAMTPTEIARHFAFLQALEPTTDILDVVRAALNIENTEECQICYSREPDTNSRVRIGGGTFVLCRAHRREYIDTGGRFKKPMLGIINKKKKGRQSWIDLIMPSESQEAPTVIKAPPPAPKTPKSFSQQMAEMAAEEEAKLKKWQEEQERLKQQGEDPQQSG